MRIRSGATTDGNGSSSAMLLFTVKQAVAQRAISNTQLNSYPRYADTVKLKEAEMLSVLDRIVSENGLSYTECCFEKLNGKVISPKEKPSE